MKTVSAFEYAIMQAAHESDPTKLTKEDLEDVRPQTAAEVLEERKQNIKRQIEKDSNKT